MRRQQRRRNVLSSLEQTLGWAATKQELVKKSALSLNESKAFSAIFFFAVLIPFPNLGSNFCFCCLCVCVCVCVWVLIALALSLSMYMCNMCTYGWLTHDPVDEQTLKKARFRVDITVNIDSITAEEFDNDTHVTVSVIFSRFSPCLPSLSVLLCILEPKMRPNGDKNQVNLRLYK